MFLFEWRVICRYLFSLRKRGFLRLISFFSFLGILFGVAALIIVMSVMNGFRAEMLHLILGVDGHVTIKRNLASSTDPWRIQEALAAMPQVRMAVPEVRSQVMVMVDQPHGAFLKGIRPEDLQKIEGIGGHLIKGFWKDFQGDEALVVGEAMAARLGIGVGDQLRVLSPNGFRTAFGRLPQSRSFTIAGIFRTGMYEYDLSYIYTPLAGALSFIGDSGGFTHWEVYLKDPDQPEAFIDGLIQPFGEAFSALMSWKDQRASLFEALEVEQNVMFIILSLIIFVAAFNIISSLIMLVQSKAEEIAILRTMGAQSGSIVRIFIGVGGLLGIGGTFMGVAVGIGLASSLETIRQFLNRVFGLNLFSENVYFLSHLPSKIVPSEVFFIALFAVGFSFLATLYPAWRASKLQVREVLYRGV